MSIGDAFPYTVPIVGSASWGGPLNNILNELITRVSSTVPLTALGAGPLDLQNTPIENAEYVQLQEQASVPAATPVGRLEYYNGNFYLVNASAAIQVTDGDNLNFAAVGGIGGDYGTGFESVQFVGASERYDFYDDFNTLAWGRIRARSFDVANGATGTDYARIQYGGAGTLTFTLPPTLPAATDSMLMIDNAGAITHNAVANPVSNHIYLDTTTYVKHGDRIVHYPPMIIRDIGDAALSTGTWNSINIDAVRGTAFGVLYLMLPGVQRHWRLKSLKVFLFKTTGVNNITVELMRSNIGTFTQLATATVTASGETSGTATAGAPYTPVTGDVFFARVTTTVNNDVVRGLELTYDVV